MKIKISETYLFGIIIILCLATGCWNLHTDNVKMKSELDYYNTNYLSKIGGTSTWNGQMLVYNLRSFDAGKHWFAVTNSGDGFVVVGEAEKLYPGLIDNLKAWDEIVKYTASNGPITLNNSQQVQLMERAGFVIKTNK
jgi:hypothetical protein